MFRLVMPFNIVLFAYCHGFIANKAMWYAVDFNKKILQPPFVLENTFLFVHLSTFRIHGAKLGCVKRVCKNVTNFETA